MDMIVYAGGAADRLQQPRCGGEDGGRLVVRRGLRGRLHQLGRPPERPHSVHAPAACQFQLFIVNYYLN